MRPRDDATFSPEVDVALQVIDKTQQSLVASTTGSITAGSCFERVNQGFSDGNLGTGTVHTKSRLRPDSTRLSAQWRLAAPSKVTMKAKGDTFGNA